MDCENYNNFTTMHPLISPIQKVALYETKTILYIVATNNTQTKFRVLKIDRMEPRDLVVIDDRVEYSQDEVHSLINLIDVSNRGRAGATKGISAFGIIGFVRFLEGYYVIMVRKRCRVALIGLHTIYKVEDTAMQYIPNESVRVSHPDEPRYLKMFQSIDLSSNFYFSYSYDVTHTLQINMAIPQNINSITTDNEQGVCVSSEPTVTDGVEDAEMEDLFPPSMTEKLNERTLSQKKPIPRATIDCAFRSSPNRRFIWNTHLLSKVEHVLHPDWILYITHGFVSQSNISIFGRSIYVTLIARRSNKYAGTRFLKRGANFDGDVANEVETEQVVQDMGVACVDMPRASSFVQMRGSIPAHWSQDISKMVPKPAIAFDLGDPYAQTAGAHFNQLFSRYGSPVIILNLVKKRERKKHESQLSEDLSSKVNYLNLFLPPEHHIQYVTFDMARMNKGKEANVMGRLADIAESAVSKTGLYVSECVSGASVSIGVERLRQGEVEGLTSRLQTGVIRVNCVDCLDRTNTAQFALGKCALGYQLCALGLLATPRLAFDSDCVRLLEVLYEDHGDTLALQYGGSQLVHRIKTYRKTAPWTSQGNDIMQTLSRYYSNTFSDAEKQHAMNLFLGLFVPDEALPPIWEQTTDYYLHHPLAVGKQSSPLRRSPLTQWWECDVLASLPLAKAYRHKMCSSLVRLPHRGADCINAYGDLHRPHELSVLGDTYAYKISHSVRDFMPHCVTDYSPFTVRVRPGRRWEETAKGANIKNPSLTGQSSTSSTTSSASSSPESEEEDLDFCLDSPAKQSPMRECSVTKTSFPELFPSMKQTYGVEIAPPNKQDILLYGRYVLLGRVATRKAETETPTIISRVPQLSVVQPVMLNSLLPTPNNTAYQVITMPTVTPTSYSVYEFYVKRATTAGVPCLTDQQVDKYKSYVMCGLRQFSAVGWDP